MVLPFLCCEKSDKLVVLSGIRFVLNDLSLAVVVLSSALVKGFWWPLSTSLFSARDNSVVKNSETTNQAKVARCGDLNLCIKKLPVINVTFLE